MSRTDGQRTPGVADEYREDMPDLDRRRDRAATTRVWLLRRNSQTRQVMRALRCLLLGPDRRGRQRLNPALGWAWSRHSYYAVIVVLGARLGLTGEVARRHVPGRSGAVTYYAVIVLLGAGLGLGGGVAAGRTGGCPYVFGQGGWVLFRAS